MSKPDEPSALDAVFWRDEILQVMFWLKGEGLKETASAADLTVFLPADEATLTRHLNNLVEEGYLERDRNGSRFALTELGHSEGGRRFADAFEGMQQQGHGECSDDCVCQEEGPEACPVHPHVH